MLFGDHSSLVPGEIIHQGVPKIIIIIIGRDQWRDNFLGSPWIRDVAHESDTNINKFTHSRNIMKYIYVHNHNCGQMALQSSQC